MFCLFVDVVVVVVCCCCFCCCCCSSFFVAVVYVVVVYVCVHVCVCVQLWLQSYEPNTLLFLHFVFIVISSLPLPSFSSYLILKIPAIYFCENNMTIIYVMCSICCIW